MRNQIEHNETHQRMIRWLVEDELVGEEKLQAERNLLSCDECLEEYNWYSQVWESMTNPERFNRWTTQLREKDPKQYLLYSQVVERLSEYKAAKKPYIKSGYWSSVRIWRNLAFALSVILLVALPIALYRMATLNSRLEKYVKPSANAILSMQFFTTRQTQQVQEIEFPKDKLFLNLQIRASEEKPYQTYSLLIKGSLGKTLWRDDQIKKDEEGNFDLLIGKSFLTPGEYVLEIYGLQDQQSDLISQTRFRIRG